MMLINLRRAVEEVAAAVLVATLLALLVFSCTACASLQSLTESAAQAQREVAAVVEAHQALEAACAEEQPPQSAVCRQAERARAAVERLLARLPVELPMDPEELQP